MKRRHGIGSAVGLLLGAILGSLAAVTGGTALLSAGIAVCVTAAIAAPAAVSGFAWAGLWIVGDAIPPGMGLLASGLLLALSLACSASTLRWSSLPGAFWWWGVAWLAVLGASSAVHPGSETKIAQVLYGGVLLVVTALLSSERRGRLQMLAVTGALGLLLSVAEVLRVASGGLVHPEVAAFGLNPIDLARLTGFAALAWLWLSAEVARKGWPIVLQLAGLACVAGTFATGSRGPFAALIVGLIFWLLSSRGGFSSWILRLLFCVGTAISVTWAAGFAGARSSAGLIAEDSARIEAWEAAVSTALAYPLFGAGLGNYLGTMSPVTVLEYPHNVFLQAAAELGLPAFMLLLALGALSFRTGNAPARGMLLFSALCISVSGHIGQSQIWWVAAGLGLACAGSNSTTGPEMQTFVEATT